MTIEEEIKAALISWLKVRFKGSWWVPNPERVSRQMIEKCNIRTMKELNQAIQDGQLEEVINARLDTMREVVRSRVNHRHYNGR